MGENRRVSHKNKVIKLSKGVLSTLTDVCLFIFFFHIQAYKIAYGKRDVGEAINKAVHLAKITNSNNLNRIIYKLKHRGFLEKKEDYLKITKLGQDRLASILPKYYIKRPWDGNLYLITYDIPEEKKSDREYLRQYLKKLGCAMLQKSVWITPYNPKRLIIDFVKERSIFGLVLVSELREGSGIGGKDILTVVEKVYGLNLLNQRYEEFVKEAKNKKLLGMQLLMTYLSILKKDPQIPFELLPGGWWGNEAYKVFKREAKRLNKNT